MPPSVARTVAACFLGAALLSAGLSCSKTETMRTQIPELLPDSTVNQIRDLINLGYAQLDSAKLQEAVGSFAQVSQLVPNGLVGEYHTACAYARTGDKEQAFAFLSRVVDSGFDNPEQLDNDMDFEGLKGDPRFEQLLARALHNFSESSATLAAGMPEYETAPRQFTTEDEFNAWVEQEDRPLRTQFRFWRTAEALMAQIDFAARRLACLRELKKNDTAFDYGLERIRALVRLRSPYEPGWGPVSDLIVQEAGTYLQRHPSGTRRGEAHFQAGLALSLKFAETNDERLESYRLAEGHLTQVPENTPYHFAALALTTINKLRTPGADTVAIGREIKGIIEQSPTDDKLFRVVATQTRNKAPRFLWPLALDKPDMDNVNVSLNDYAGKALMIDFWATWCPPCRAELPNLLRVYQEFHPKGLEIVSVSLDYAEQTTPEAYRHWIDSAGMNWRHIYDGKAWDTELVKRFFVGSIPAPFLVGKDGSLVAMGDDLRSEELEASVKRALGI